MEKLFGTDGIRGTAGEYPLDEQTIFACGISLVRNIMKQTGRGPQIIIGRDTRESGQWIEETFARGVCHAGGSAITSGVITTPAIAYLTRVVGFDAGVVISASHNQYRDNGIKIFSSRGTKLDDDMEAAMEREVKTFDFEGGASGLNSRGEMRDVGGEVETDEPDPASRIPHPVPSRITHHTPSSLAALVDEGLPASYLRFLSDQVAGGLNLSGLRLALDCANGAAYQIAPQVLHQLGAEVHALGVEPDGTNINLDCGSLHPEKLQRLVTEKSCHLGIAFDGDADRALFIGPEGEVFDGDHTLYILALYLQDRERLKGNNVVGTDMSNLGLERALARRSIRLHRTRVGDRFVLEKLLELDASVGGEQSGHIIIPEISLTGDGLITALHVLRVIKETGTDFYDLVEGFDRYPQTLINMPVKKKPPFETVPEIMETVRTVEERLRGRGRLLLRYSGTEPLARVMVEADEETLVNETAREVAEVVQRHLGAETTATSDA